MSAEAERVSRDRWVARAMGTVFSVTIPGAGEGAPGIVAAIAADWRRVEGLCSVFRPDSELRRWRAGLVPDEGLRAETLEVMADCARLERTTEGAFSPHGPTGYDPTGYVKGWALARGAARLEAAGVDSYCVNGGGDVVARGLSQRGVGWRVGVAHPRRPRELSTVVTSGPARTSRARLAVATSGLWERGRHVRHPLDGWRPRRSCVTVVGEDIALADALATAALAAGRDGSERSAALVAWFGLEAFGFDEEGRPWWTAGMPAHALLPAGSPLS